MNKANAADLGFAIRLAQKLTEAGVLFVPIPVLDDDRDALMTLANARLDRLLERAEQEENP